MSTKTQKHICAIESIFVQLLNGAPPTIELNDWAKAKNLHFTDRLSMAANGNVQQRHIRFSVKTSRTLFTVVVHLLQKVHSMLRTNCCYTRREIYYQEINVIHSQAMVDYALQIICVLLNCPPWELGIMASSKGLVAGPLLIKNARNEIVDCNSPGGTLIPHFISATDTEMRSKAEFVLLVEKDATFQKLLSEGILEEQKHMILVTGKGYPDINTRILINKLNYQLKLPVLAMVDADPHGIAIMCVYRYGSAKMSSFARSLVTPEVKWLGIHPSDLQNKNIETLSLTNHDVLRLQSLFKKEYIASNKDLADQINIMLQNRRKAEIETFCTLSPNFLTKEYIPLQIIHKKLY